MFTWLNNLFPYSDLHSLNLDWILNKMKETAALAAKAVADSANALAQVLEAKTAAQNAQTAAENAQTAANNAQTAANNAADSAENAVTVAQQAQSAAQTAQNTANTARSAAQTAQNTAETAQSAAQNAASAAENAQNTANAAQTAAENAQNTANGVNDKFPIKTSDISNGAVTNEKIADSAISGSKLAKRSINREKLSFSTINAGFESYSSTTDVTATVISANEMSFTFPIQGAGSFVDSTAAFIRLVKPSTVAGEKKYIKTSPFPANRTGNNATFDCERQLIIGEIFDNNDNELGICIIKSSTIYGTRADGTTGWTGNLKLLYCTTQVNFTDMNNQIGVRTVKLTNLA